MPGPTLGKSSVWDIFLPPFARSSVDRAMTSGNSVDVPSGSSPGLINTVMGKVGGAVGSLGAGLVKPLLPTLIIVVIGLFAAIVIVGKLQRV